MRTTLSAVATAITVLSMASAAFIGCSPEEDPEVAVTGVSINQSALTMEPGGTVSLSVTVTPSNATAKSVTWSSSNQAVATVNNGTVTAVGAGSATITASAGGKTANCSVTVSKKVVPVTSITLNVTEAELERGGTLTITATVTPNDATDKIVAWTSSNASVATVEDGVVKAVAVGTTTITSICGNQESTCVVTVIPTEVERIQEALMKIYDTMDGPNWKIDGKWSPSVSIDSWTGVLWYPQTHELKLVFDNFGLKGELPDCFDELTSCVSIKIQDEPGVTGTLPPSFQKLKNLGELTINRTSMTSLPDIFSGMPLWNVFIGSNPLMTGSIPESLGESDGYLGENSEYHYPIMYISDNGFMGDIPESWMRLSPRVDIYTHKFSGQIPDYFFTADDPGYWINMYINNGDVLGDDDYRVNYPFVVPDRDIPGYWPKREVKDVITGKPIPYDDIVSKNKATVIYRWGSWCSFSAALLPQLKRMYEKYHDAGLEVIMRPAWGDNEGEMLLRDYILDNGYDIWYNFSSKSSDISFSEEAALGNSAMPFANVIDNKGNIIFSCSKNVSDPSRGRFDHIAFLDLIPFLEEIFGPLEDDEVYSSTDYSMDGDVVTLQTASVGKGINIVFMGDAYTDKDMYSSGLYNEVMYESMEEFFSIEPYKTFRDRFNVYYVKVVSENGKTGKGYSTALGTDAQSTSISISGDSDNKCLEYALKIPGNKDNKNLLICVLVNSSGLRGITSMKESLQTGIAYCSSGSNVQDAFGVLVRHEAGGHGFAFLGDEYSTGNGTPSKAAIDEYNRLYSKYGWYSNLDFTNDPSKVKWNFFLTDERYKDQVGIFEGAGGPFSTGIFRPSEDSMMNHNVEHYNAPSRWAIYKRIMELSGEEVSFEKFLEYDAVNRGK